MKILYVGLLYDYGRREQGFSYEHNNIEAGFRDCAEKDLFHVDYLWPDNNTVIESDGEFRNYHWPEDLLNIIPRYDAIFHVAFNEHLDFPEQAAKLALRLDIPVIQWDCDASWRFHNWIINRKDRVSHFVTTHSATVEWYKQNSMNVIRSQWAGSPLYIKDSTVEKKYDVSFIGQKHGIRPEILQKLYQRGIEVHLFGNYWDDWPNWHGYISDFASVISVFNQSKICLNLSNPWHIGTMPQIKGRHFEIPQCGSFQLSTPADDLQTYFDFGKEIVVAETADQLADYIYYYLDNDNERTEIALAGEEKTKREHQWSHRLVDIFREIGYDV
jgi:spore maturation protein CgeB